MLETASSGRHDKEIISLPQRYFVSLMMVSVIVFASSVILCVCLGASILCVMPEEVLFPAFSSDASQFQFHFVQVAPKLPKNKQRYLYGSLTD
jgi:hypothetical protein